MSHRSFWKRKFSYKFQLLLRVTGLSLILNIEADEYLGDFSESYGAVVEVASGKEMYFPEENGYLVAPGQVTNIGFTAVSLKSLFFF